MVSEHVKQRIVGLVVLVLMMLVIAPWVLNHSEVAPSLNQNAISGMDKAIAWNGALIEADHQLKTTKISLNRKDSKVQAKKPKPQENETLKLHQQTKVMALSLPQEKNQAAWYVQVGSFTGEKNANKLMSVLLNAKQKAKIQRHTAHGISLFRVYEGPFLTKAEALSSARVNMKGQKVFAVKFKG